jgi:hypothetical protein
MSTTTERTGFLRTTGTVGLVAGVLFAAMTVWEQAGGPAAATGIGFAVATAGYVVLGTGLTVAQPGGRRARIFPILVVVAWTVLLAASAVETFTSVGPDTDALNAIGGLLQGVGLIGLGVSTAVAGRWTGWRRFWPLGLAAFYTGALFVPAAFGVEPTTALETAWAMGYAGLGVALLTSTEGVRRSTVVPVGALVVATAGLVLAAVATAPPAASASGRDCALLSEHPYASADSLEHYAQLCH